MNWEAFGAVAEAIGAIAVITTLVYLARQVSHARREQQAAAIRSNRNERRQFFELSRDSPYLPTILCKRDAGQPLTSEEEMRLLHHNSAHWALVYSEWVQSQLDLTGEYATSIETNLALVTLQPSALAWFDEYGRRLYPERFVAKVERTRKDRGTGEPT